MFDKGDIVFFKKGRKSSRTKTEVTFKGYGFGLFLGHVPPFEADPPPEHLLRIVGSCGFVSFDDVGEFFGEKVAKECVEKFEAKYYPKAALELVQLPGKDEGPKPV